MKIFTYFILLALIYYASSASSRKKLVFQTWTVCGNDIDYSPTNPLTGGNMCVGGGSIPTEAIKWFLGKANKGDVVMLIPAALNTREQEKTFSYAAEWCKFTDVPINSVKAIVVNSPEIAYLPEVLEMIQNAEAVYFTGGDQKHYWLYIKDSPLQHLLENLVQDRKVVIGGSSAGCAIQGEYLYSAEALSDTESLVYSEALSDPFTRKITIQKDFLPLSPLKNTVTDTHYFERNRVGRHIVFMARVLMDSKPALVRGVGIDRDVAVCYELNGKACVYNDNGNKALFLSVNDVNSSPEVFEKGVPLTWNNNNKAIKGYEIVGTPKGDRCFDVNEWKALNEASLSYYYVVNGLVFNNY